MDILTLKDLEHVLSIVSMIVCSMVLQVHFHQINVKEENVVHTTNTPQTLYLMTLLINTFHY